MLEEVVQSICGDLHLGNVQNSVGHGSELHDLVGCALHGGVG